eukprot:CAMPEP_0114561450 /NCGR_PEP_ID=MMETSP0114-20121206/12011_1 /TAXON_ID=31324 /ORGANISM="Goniomonas sp, Strain m" /LENGTH=494 /DNA_ID=CAMNT_0001747087 /DNA_START=16 /DNA_END=1497 /DNA_ORIENTATION=+
MVAGGGALNPHRERPQARYGSATAIDIESGLESRSQVRRRQRGLMLLGVAALALVASIYFVTNVHRTDPEHIPVELEAVKAQMKAQAAAKVSSKVAKAVSKPKPKPQLSKEERMENALKANLDRTARSLGNSQLQPLLIQQGQAILHNADHHVKKDELSMVSSHTHKAFKSPAKLPKKLHAAVEHSMGHSMRRANHPRRESQQERTEEALRKQLNMATENQEKSMFAASLKAEQQETEKSASPSDKAATAAKDTEDQLKEQLNHNVQAKEHQMYKSAFQTWMEKENAIKLKKEKIHKKIARKEKVLFKTVLTKAKQDGPKLAQKIQQEHLENEAGLKHHARHHGKPSFKAWLKAFKSQLMQRTEQANKKIVDSRYQKTHKGKKLSPDAVKGALAQATESRTKVKDAVKTLKESLAAEAVEEKAVAHAEQDSDGPGKALTNLQATMKKERAALKTITESEHGAAADPNLIELAPKAKSKAKKAEDKRLTYDDFGV